MKYKDWIILLAGLLIGAGLGIFFYFGLGIGRRQPAAQYITPGRQLIASPSVGSPAPDFVLTSLSGEPVRLSDQRGKVSLINFWATWCTPCRLEMPIIQDRVEKYASQLTVLAVNFDEPIDLVQAFVDELGLRFAVLLDPDAQVQDLYHVRGYPTTFLLDQEGVIRVQHIGFLSEKQLDQYLSDLGIGE